ncbi:LuxR family transcriptional regulator [Brucella intermedia]|uniref:HTH-type quorum sensing-dependent transcriptional regulator VjbR n=2 Tax=Brucella intermedia TaxID=94625 RepID=M5JPQ1_9HYPH|nr:LuxR family transcriptional regulator [Brucella intermedia]ERI15998.1 LuxR family transcriptional regulator [Ochrobactrum sp. EGD-AQ16]KAB2668388.1 LuxR family transcriptional regulator [Ochrobactrum sp. LMG 5442]PJT20004.1 LuxR family transcriptional regulator [Ochrobactrum sp. 30A/1000/2015]PJT40136.1 LuxR family transcriptional regulator [Ochrobactrum sp. 27A/999/2015]PJT45382.1 LuxR family transcriptional regulator [Ochrobactrum sp. 23A/997/2015]HCH72458.1 LuxR family transcriptional r
MTLDLIHFPNFKKTFFGTSFQSDTLALLTRIRDEIGCRHILHTYRGRMGDCSKTSSSDLTVVMTVPANWAARYSTKNYFVVDPIFQEDAPYFKDDVSGIVRNLQEDADQCPAVADMLQDAEKHGLGNIFIAVSARGQKGAVGCSLFSFEISPDEDREQFVAKLRPRLLSLSGIIHSALCGCKDVATVSSLLTPREVDCLRWAANGKTDGEIAEILNIARWTVVTYLQNAKIKLNCSNRTSAVATALSLGIIEMPEVHHLN